MRASSFASQLDCEKCEVMVTLTPGMSSDTRTLCCTLSHYRHLCRPLEGVICASRKCLTQGTWDTRCIYSSPCISHCLGSRGSSSSSGGGSHEPFADPGMSLGQFGQGRHIQRRLRPHRTWSLRLLSAERDYSDCIPAGSSRSPKTKGRAGSKEHSLDQARH